MKKIFFLHIGKTAGSTFNSFLKKNFTGEVHCERFLLKDTQKFSNIEYLKELDYVSGHLNISVFEKNYFCRDDYVLLTFLRDPIKQLFSHINWIIHIRDIGNKFFNDHPDYIKEMSLELRATNLYDVQSFIDKLNKFQWLFKNNQSRYFVENFNFISLDTVLNNISQLDLVGITEKYSQALEDFIKLQGLDIEPIVETINKNIYYQVGLDLLENKTVFDFLQEYQSVDIDVYNYFLQNKDVSQKLDYSLQGKGNFNIDDKINIYIDKKGNYIDDSSFMVKNKQSMRFGIGSIFKNEFDYVLEWLAWHRIAGFSRFFICDNGSTDGTRQLLEALSEIGMIDFLFVPAQEKAQLVAYQKILDEYAGEIDAIAYIDADEFICSDDEKKPTEHLDDLFNSQRIGAVGINWRVFGSSNKVKYEHGLVVDRFQRCAEDEYEQNACIKSVVRCAVIRKPWVHHATILENFRYINCIGDDIAFLNKDRSIANGPTGRSKITTTSPLRINHYITKSLQEFTEKKRKRGDAMLGPDYDRGIVFFKNHDRNSIEFTKASAYSGRIYSEIEMIKDRLRKNTYFYETLVGVIDQCNASYIVGWVSSIKAKVRVNISVNGKPIAKLWAFLHRPGTLNKNISKDGNCGFYYRFSPPLEIGDVVNVSVYANNFVFSNNNFIIDKN